MPYTLLVLVSTDVTKCVLQIIPWLSSLSLLGSSLVDAANAPAPATFPEVEPGGQKSRPHWPLLFMPNVYTSPDLDNVTTWAFPTATWKYSYIIFSYIYILLFSRVSFVFLSILWPTQLCNRNEKNLCQKCKSLHLCSQMPRTHCCKRPKTNIFKHSSSELWVGLLTCTIWTVSSLAIFFGFAGFGCLLFFACSPSSPRLAVPAKYTDPSSATIWGSSHSSWW